MTWKLAPRLPPRAGAALNHLALSAAIALAVFLPIYFFWYPDVLYESAGGKDIFLIIVGVDVALGPLITLIIFRPGKRGLAFDLVVIVLLQTLALAYGVWVLFEARPAYIAFVKDRYEIVRANGFPEGELEKAHAKGYDDLPVTGPKLVGVRLPKDPDELFRLMISGFAGVDAEYYPRYYVPYDQVRDEVRMQAMPLETLRKRNPHRKAEVDAAVAATGRAEDQVRFLPMRSGKADLSVLVDRKTGDVLRITSLQPWPQE
ncbi:MAG TPA: TfpX/TfpZ family type IV pilin accessory protein [Usitatibacter sp.]|nr:TfpX/TfpZ family type IV pilin accessory protein [Usitatibacter sp.]